MEKLNVSNKTLLFVLSIILILVVIISQLVGLSDNSSIDYEEVTAESLFDSGVEIKDRKLYYTLEKIITDYIKSYNNPKDKAGNAIQLDAEYPEVEYTYVQYYDSLSDSFKDHLSKFEYIDVAEKFLQKFVINSDITGMDTSEVLNQIYKIEENTYICKVYSKTNKETGYIGIALNTGEKEFRIFIIG